MTTICIWLILIGLGCLVTVLIIDYDGIGYLIAMLAGLVCICGGMFVYLSGHTEIKTATPTDSEVMTIRIYDEREKLIDEWEIRR